MTGVLLAAFSDAVVTITWLDLVIVLAFVILLLYVVGRGRL